MWRGLGVLGLAVAAAGCGGTASPAIVSSGKSAAAALTARANPTAPLRIAARSHVQHDPTAPAPASTGPLPGGAVPGIFAGATSQGRHLNLDVNASGSAVVALHFSIAYRCTQASHVSLRVAVYRPLRQWEILDSEHRGFSEWFTGPIGHDFHVIGTFAQDGRSLTGTLHSLLWNPRLGTCDSGHLHYSAKLVHRPVAQPATRAITLTEYHSVEPGTPITGVVARFGPPPDHESFSPSHTIVDPYPLNGGLTYIRRGHPRQQLCFVGRDGRIVPFGAC
jgi:hypothetical protein